MIIHYKNKRHKSYPATGCGKMGMSMETTDDITKTTCKNCIKSYNKIMPKLRSRKDKKTRRIVMGWIYLFCLILAVYLLAKIGRFIEWLFLPEKIGEELKYSDLPFHQIIPMITILNKNKGKIK